MFGFIPLEIEQRVKNGLVPAANALLIIANVVMFVIIRLTGWCWPVGPGSGLLSIVLYGFCHVSFWHLLINMWTLWVFGNPVNRRLGNGCYLLAYLGTIVALGMLARICYFGDVLGASGGIFAVIAIAMFLLPAARLVLCYWAIFPFSLVPAVIRPPKYGISWFIYAGTCRVKMLWCLALVVLLELISLFVAIWSAYATVWNLGHLLGMLCGVAVVLMLPSRITMRTRAAFDSF
ncbi:MAG TPA: rhomboid family intramembrane serine protease [Pirellulaceae bacterium]|nr:rhomboid family intramembrane serine protease [Pirellulaceae bacterium]